MIGVNGVGRVELWKYYFSAIEVRNIRNALVARRKKGVARYLCSDQTFGSVKLEAIHFLT
jgi:hypothetical protein